VNSIRDFWKKTPIAYFLKRSLVTVLALEWILWLCLDGELKHAFSFFTPWLLTGILLVLGMQLVLFAMTARRSIAVALAAISVAGLGCAHILKAKMLGNPLFFADIVLAKEGLRALPYLLQNSLWIVGGVVLLLGLCAGLWSLARRDSFRQPFAMRGTLALLAVVLITLIFSVARVPYESLFPANSFRDSKVVRTGLLPFLALSYRYAKA
jgi:hypothetical protein